MPGRLELLLLAEAVVADTLRENLLAGGGGPLAVAGSVLEAEFRLGQRSRDLLIIDGRLPGLERPLPHFLLTGPPVVLVLDEERGPDPRPENGVSLLWMPRRLVIENPPLLMAALEQAGQMVELIRRQAESQRQMEALLTLLSTAGNSTPGPRWYSHRVMLERLAEEIARVDRHGGALSLVLAEVAPMSPDGEPDTQALLWVAEQLGQRKRSCDVLGQYGPHGFMLLLPQTQSPGARECCHRLTGVLRNVVEGQPSPWRLDYGIASYQPPHQATKTLLRLAEEELACSRGR